MVIEDIDLNEEGLPPSKKYKPSPIECIGPGYDYQVQLLMLFAYKGYLLSKEDQSYFYEIGKERKEAGQFDDLVVRDKQNLAEKWNYLLIQVKHINNNIKDKITSAKLLSNTGPFALLKYFSYYVESKKKYEDEKIQSCVIATNTDFEFEYSDVSELKIKVANARKGEAGKGKRGMTFYLKEQDRKYVHRIFHMSEEEKVKYYKLDDNNYIINELIEEFRKSIHVIKLKSKKIDTEEDIVKYLEHVVEVDIQLAKELKDFLKSLLFVVNLPDRNAVRKIVKKKIGKELCWLDDSIIDQFNRKMFDYTITRNKDFLKDSEIKEFFMKVKKTIKDILLLSSFYRLKIKDSKIDFIDKKIAKDFNNFLTADSTIRILTLKTDTVHLTAIKINKILKESLTEYLHNNKFNFVGLKEIIESQTLHDNIIESFKSENSFDLLVIINDGFDVDVNKVKNLQNELYGAAIENDRKKVVFISKENLDWTEGVDAKYFRELTDSGNDSSNLTDKSKENLLKQRITFQGRSIRLKELFFGLKGEQQQSPEQLKQLKMNIKTLEILDKGSITIAKQCNESNLEGAYSKFYVEVEINILIKRLEESKADRFFFIISGIDGSKKRETLYKNLKANSNRQTIEISQDQIHELKNIKSTLYTKYPQDIKKIILVDSTFKEDDFKQLCHNNPGKNFYWIIWKDNKFIFNMVYYPEFLKRKFKCPEGNISNSVLKALLSKNDIFLFTGINALEDLFEVLQLQDKEDENKIRANYQEKNIIIQEMDDKGFTELVEEKAKEKKIVYWLRIENDNDGKQIIWHDVTRKNNILQEDIIHFMRDKSSILIDKPGMGKSTSLTILSQEMLESHWVLPIILRDWQEIIISFFKDIEINNDVLVNFLSETKNLRSPLEVDLARYILDQKHDGGLKLLFLFDGFDEIRRSDTENIGKKSLERLLSFLKKEKQCTIWITAREHDAPRLKKALSVFDIKFEPIEDKLQKQYFKNVWSNFLAFNFPKHELDNNIFADEDNKFQRYYDAFSSALNKILDENKSNDFMGIPLTLRLFAEGFRDNFKNFIVSDNLEDFSNLDIFELYRKFIDEKFKIFLREKTNLSSYFTKVLEDLFKENIKKLHYRLAFKELFGEVETKELLGIKEPFKSKNNLLSIDEDLLHELLSFGIIRSVKEKIHYEFLHRTLAEYFVSELFIYLLKSKEQNNLQKHKKVIQFIKSNILKDSGKVIFKFLSAKSEDDIILKRTWDLLKIRDEEHQDLLRQPAESKNTFILKNINDESKKMSNIREMHDTWEELSGKMEDAITWNRRTFLYNDSSEGRYSIGIIKKFVDKFFTETNTNQLEMALRHLIKLLNKSEFHKFNEFLTEKKMDDLFKYYISQLKMKNLSDVEFIESFCQELYQEIVSNDNSIDKTLRQRVKEKHNISDISKLFSETAKYESSEFKTWGANVVLASLILTEEMARTFITSKYDEDIFEKLIIPLLSFKFFAKDNHNTFTKIDSFALLCMFEDSAHKSKKSLTLSKISLEGLLECIKHSLHPDKISQETFFISMKAFDELKTWNFRLAYNYNSLCISDRTGDYEYLLTLQNSEDTYRSILFKSISTFLISLSRARESNTPFDFQEECKAAFKSIFP